MSESHMITSIEPLRFLYLNPFSGCNLRCRHCWVNEGYRSGAILDVSQWTDIVEQASALGCTSIKFTGGEPLCYTDFTRLYTAVARIVPHLSIETNGTVQPPGLWEAFRSHAPFHLAISLDSSDKVIHDGFRGVEGSWERTVDFLKKALDIGVNTQVIMSISTVDRAPIEGMIETLEVFGAKNLRVNLITSTGRGKGIGFMESNPPGAVLDFFHWLDQLPRWVSASVPPAFSSPGRLPYRGSCPIRNLLGVLPDGTYSICGAGFFMEEFSWGRYPETSVRMAWEGSPVYQGIRECVPLRIGGVCGRCVHRLTCRGNCVVNNSLAGGSITSPDSICQAMYEAGLFPDTRLS